MFPAMIHVNESISGSDWVYGFWSQLKYSLFRSGWCTIKHSALMIVVLLFNKIFFIKLFYNNVALGQNFISFYYFLINNGYCFIQSFFISSISINICLIHKIGINLAPLIYCPICFLFKDLCRSRACAKLLLTSERKDQPRTSRRMYSTSYTA